MKYKWVILIFSVSFNLASQQISTAACTKTSFLPSLDGNSSSDLCIRDSGGIACYFSNNNGFPTSVRGPAYTDVYGWNLPQYYSTIQFPDINGDGCSDVCTRDSGGIQCSFSNGSGFTPSVRGPNWGDTSWNKPSYYLTIQYPDINGDRKADICGRDAYGIVCALATGNGFASSFRGPVWGDGGLWGKPEYYSTIQFPDINGDGKADVCGRSAYGIACYLSTGTAFSTMMIQGPPWGDGALWNEEQYYSTIQFTDINGDKKDDICARAASGVSCYLSNGSAFATHVNGPPWSDSGLWNYPQYYSTIQFADINGDSKSDICARAALGMICHLSTGTEFKTDIFGPAWSDAKNWDRVEYYSTIQFADINGDGRADVCGRGPNGMECAFSNGNSFSSVITGPAFNDTASYNRPEYFTTIRLTSAKPKRLPIFPAKITPNATYILPITVIGWTGETADAILAPRYKRDFGNGSESRVVGFSAGMSFLNWTVGPKQDVDLAKVDEVLNASARYRLPALLHLNAHRWTVAQNPPVISNDRNNLMYTQDGISILDLPDWQVPAQRNGSFMWSLNVYNTAYRNLYYKNLGQVAQKLVKFKAQFPGLFAGVSLDSEVSLCPASFIKTYAFEYGIDTVIQWRHWLSGGTGSYSTPSALSGKYFNPYASGAKYAGQGKNLTLNYLKLRYGINYLSWETVNPPRIDFTSWNAVAGVHPNLWQDWLEFRASLVNNHLRENVNFLSAYGLPTNQIYTHQAVKSSNYTGSDYEFCGVTYQSSNVSGAGMGIDTYNLETLDSKLFNTVKTTVNSNWGITEWNPQGQSAESALKAAAANGIRVICPNWYHPTLSDPGENLNIVKYPELLKALKRFGDGAF